MAASVRAFAERSLSSPLALHTIIRSVFCLAARRADFARNALYLGRAGEQKTDWTKPRATARYGDCMA